MTDTRPDTGEASRPIRVLLVDDQAIVRKGMGAPLSMAPDIEVVGEAPARARRVALVQRLRLDVILMDLEMPGVDGIEATRRVVAERPEARVVAATSFATDDKVFPALKAGTQGYLLKDGDPAELVRAICQVHRLARRRCTRPLRAGGPLRAEARPRLPGRRSRRPRHAGAATSVGPTAPCPEAPRPPPGPPSCQCSAARSGAGGVQRGVPERASRSRARGAAVAVVSAPAVPRRRKSRPKAA